VAAAVLSGNRNFEGRINADVRANYLASPPLVVAYALAGSMYADLVKQPLGLDKKGKKVFLKDIWPTSREIISVDAQDHQQADVHEEIRRRVQGRRAWRKISVKGGLDLCWDKKSTYVQNPPYFVGMTRNPAPLTDIVDARCWRSCSTPSPPTTSRRRARSRSIRRPANI
jgi:aconitate hydratase